MDERRHRAIVEGKRAVAGWRLDQALQGESARTAVRVLRIGMPAGDLPRRVAAHLPGGGAAGLSVTVSRRPSPGGGVPAAVNPFDRDARGNAETAHRLPPRQPNFLHRCDHPLTKDPRRTLAPFMLASFPGQHDPSHPLTKGDPLSVQRDFIPFSPAAGAQKRLTSRIGRAVRGDLFVRPAN